jgi:hypothetical protein
MVRHCSAVSMNCCLRGIARLFGVLFALSRVGAIFFCFGVTAVALFATWTNVTGQESTWIDPDLHQPTSTITNLAAATAPSAKLNEKRTSLKIVMPGVGHHGLLLFNASRLRRRVNAA